MRITKVKVDNKDVLMQRNTQEGFLLHGEHEKKNEKILAFIQSKESDFIKSIMGKTLIKTGLKKLSKNELEEYFNHKFKTKVEYGAQHAKKGFNLIDDLYNALEKYNNLKDIANALSSYAADKPSYAADKPSYAAWKDWYIQRKQRLLTKSIVNNKIDYQQNISPRKKVLEEWARQLVANPQVDIASNLAQQFDIEALCEKWKKRLEDAQKYSKEDIKEKNLEEYKLDTPKDYFEFKRCLKNYLFNHQKQLHKSGQLNYLEVDQLSVQQDKQKNSAIIAIKIDCPPTICSNALNQYSLEVSKYLMRYFPLKKSARRLSKDDVEHYLNVDTVKKIIKNQIDNAVIAYLLQQGKAIYYNFDGHVDSQTLQRFKSQEAFALQFIDACAFAGNNLRNCINAEEKNDLLSKNNLSNAYSKLEEDSVKLTNSQYCLARFFTTITTDPKTHQAQSNFTELNQYFNKNNDNYKNFVAAVRSSISQIRNQVFHFKKEALDKILNITEFEPLAVNNDNSYENSHLKTLLQQEIHNLPLLFSEKLKSAGLFDFYSLEDLKKHFNCFSLTSKPLAFIPGFKTVFKWGLKYAEDKTYPLELGDTFFRKPLNNDNQIDPALQARYNAMALIYEHFFIGSFMSDNSAFQNAVNAVLKANKKQAENKHEDKRKNKHAAAFKDIPRPNRQENIIDYLKNIQSQLIQEENKKREDDPDFSSQDTGNFQQFLWQVFLKGFDSYMRKEEFSYLKTPCNQIEKNNQTAAQQSNARNQLTAEFATIISKRRIQHKINFKEGKQIAFWTFCKMLDTKHLNELLNQMTKWQQASDKLDINQPNIERAIHSCQEIIQLCLLSVDRISGQWADHYQDHLKYVESLTPYLENAVDPRSGIFCQEDGSPIIFAPIEIAKKYATAGIIQQALNKDNAFKLSQKNIEDWQKQLQADNSPAKLATKRQKLHKEWVENKDKNWLENNKKTYQEVCEQIEAYNWLDNKVKFIHIQRLHHLLMDILGRFVGFVALFERDFYFLTDSLNQYIAEPFKPSDLSFYGANQKYKNFYYGFFVSDKNKDNNAKNKPSLNDWHWKDHRNFIAHFNYLGQTVDTNNKNTQQTISILELLANVRDLVAYDRKLKNAVAKSFIDLLSKHGIEIKFEPLHKNNHQFVIQEIKSKQIEHLGGKVLIDQHPQEYINMVKALLELKPS